MTLESYLETIGFPFELFIIDNASNDESVEIIKAIAATHENVTPILLADNYGGYSLNLGIARSTGAYIHLSENDVEYLPGWSQRVVELFEKRAELGQLSLYGPVPTDEEICDHARPIPWESGGELLYEIASERDNVPLTSVLRRQIFDSGANASSVNYQGPGSTLENEPEHQKVAILPNDQDISRQVQDLGLRIAWSDHYLVRNLGDSIEEFRKRPDYYNANYSAKAVGVAGWQQRITRWNDMPKPTRTSPLLEGHPLLAGESLSPELCEPTNHYPYPNSWTMFDAWTPELEVCEFIFGLVRMVKPAHTVLSRAWRGHLASFVARALKMSDYGTCTALEDNPDSCEIMRMRLEDEGADMVQTRNILISQYVPESVVDMAVLECRDCGREVTEALMALMKHFVTGTVIVLLSTQQAHTDPPFSTVIETLATSGLASGIDLPTPRGVTVLQWQAGNTGPKI